MSKNAAVRRRRNRTLRRVVLFARVPQLGTVKSRLARDIGRHAALRFYRGCLGTVVRRLARDPRWRLEIAITPDTSRSVILDGNSSGVALFGQGRGDLGARMARVFRRSANGPTLIIGSDIPGIDGAAIQQAFRHLERNRAVFGKAEDGGYWLVGLAGGRVPPRELFKNVRWSTEYALEDTLTGLPTNWQVSFLGTKDDIDDGDAYGNWRDRGGSL